MKCYKNLLFISDNDMYELYKEKYPTLLQTPETAILTLDISVGNLFAQEDVYYLPDLISENNAHLPLLDQIDDFVANIPHFFDNIKYKGVNIAKCLQKSILHPYRSALLSQLGIRVLTQRITWKHLYLCTELKNPIYLDTGSVFETDTLQAILAHYCLNKKISLHWLNPKKRINDADKYLRHLVAQTHIGQEPFFPLTYPPINNPFLSQIQNKKRILFIGNSTDTHDAKLLIDALKKDNSETFFLNCSTRGLFDYQETQNSMFLDYRYLYAFPDMDPKTYKQYTKRLEKKIDLFYNHPFFREHEIDTNHFLDFLKHWMYDCFFETVKVIAATQHLHQAYQPHVAIFGYGIIGSIVSASIAYLQDNQVPTVHILHGGYLNPDHFKLFPESNFTYVRGAAFKKRIEKYTKLQTGIKIVGDLREQPTQSVSHSTQPQPKHSTKPQILFISSKISMGPYFGKKKNMALSQFTTAYQEIINLSKQREDIVWRWKAHPRHDYLDFYEKNPKGNLVFENPQKNLMEILGSIDLCVIFNVQSSSIVEAAVMGIPTLVLKNLYDEPESDYIHPQAIAHSTEELEVKIDQILSSASAREENIRKILALANEWCIAQNNQALTKAWHSLQIILKQQTKPTPVENMSLRKLLHAQHLSKLRMTYLKTQNQAHYLQERTQWIHSFPKAEQHLASELLTESESWI